MAKKKREKDFQKVKLKVGRKLKRTTETKTSFKSKKIVLRETQSVAEDPIRCLSAATGNSRTKLSCLTKLNDLMPTIDVKFVNGELINLLSKFLTDEDERLRLEAVKCIKQCMNISQAKNKDIETLLCMLLTYLNCGLTHINKSIVSDAHKLMLFIVDKCQSSSLDHFMNIMISRISICSNISVQDIELLAKLVFKLNQGNDFPDQNEMQLKWTPENCNLNVNSTISYKHPPQFNISFQLKSEVDTKQKFLEVVNSLIEKEMKLLFFNQQNISLSLTEGRKALAVLKVASSLAGGKRFGKRPTITLSSTNWKKSTKKEQKDINNMKGEIDFLIGKLFV